MYSYKQINGVGHVIHNETGCSLPYHSKAVKYTNQLLAQHLWKLDYFRELFNYSNSQRKKIKHMKSTEAIQFLSSTGYSTNNFCLESCTTAAPTVKCKVSVVDSVFGCKQEGTNPMYNECKKTEADVSRQYLTGRLGDANYTKRDQLRKLFNLDTVAIPKSYKELIDAIKNGKYTVDDKAAKRIDFSIEEEGRYYGSPLDGIIFTDFPKPDYEGHAVASTAQAKELTKVKDAIYVLPAADALAALVAFEAWMPTTA